ncbi:MAG TPA: flagellar basal body protein FliL, partial [Burkholderiaceae bacterium]|nr:flagellar basal body protein FliL [Burkholderiaceae bacterium]
EILTHEGKVELAEEIARETGRAIGWKPPKKPKKKVAKSEDGEEEEEEEPPKKSKAKPNPIEQVQFSQFIVQ